MLYPRKKEIYRLQRIQRLQVKQCDRLLVFADVLYRASNYQCDPLLGINYMLIN